MAYVMKGIIQCLGRKVLKIPVKVTSEAFSNFGVIADLVFGFGQFILILVGTNCSSLCVSLLDLLI